MDFELQESTKLCRLYIVWMQVWAEIKTGQIRIIPICPVKSGWQDSNLRPPGPKPGAITGLRYIPKR